MGHQIIKQPDGLYCVFSSIVDNVIMYNAKPEDIIQMWLEDKEKEMQRRVADVTKQLDEGGKPYYQFTKSYDEMLDWIKEVHGKDMRKKVKASIENDEDCEW